MFENSRTWRQTLGPALTAYSQSEKLVIDSPTSGRRHYATVGNGIRFCAGTRGKLDKQRGYSEDAGGFKPLCQRCRVAWNLAQQDGNRATRLVTEKLHGGFEVTRPV